MFEDTFEGVVPSNESIVTAEFDLRVLSNVTFLTSNMSN